MLTCHKAFWTSRIFFVVFLTTAFVVSFTGLSTAASLEPAEKDRFEVRFSDPDDDRSLGVGMRVKGDWWVIVNLDHLGRAGGPEADVNALYRVPRKLLFFDLYGGMGARSGGDTSDPTLSVTAGAGFWILFWENEYPLDDSGRNLYRSGFRVAF